MKELLHELRLDTPIQGMDVSSYIAQLLEKNDNQEIEIERGKLSVAMLKQMNNHSRLVLDGYKYKLKASELKNIES